MENMMFVWLLLALVAATVQSLPAANELPSGQTAVESMTEMLNGCGVTKSCLAETTTCMATNVCTLGATVVAANDLYTFEMRTLKGVYVAVGLSSDARMGNDAVVECVYNNVTLQVDTFVSWNVGHSNIRIPTSLQENGIAVLASTYVDESVYCKFTRQPITTVQDHLFDLDVAPYYLLIAAGNKLKPDSVGFHDMAYAVSTHSQYLYDIGMFDGSNDIMTPEESMAAMTKECGITLACYTKTKNSSSVGMVTVGATVLHKNDLYIFEMRATIGLYIAVGLSDDRKMGGDSVVDCRYNNSKVSAYVSWNNDNYTNTRLNSSLEENGIVLLDASYKDGSVYCKFTREAVTVVKETIFDLNTTPYYLVLAAGNKLTANGELVEHNIVDGASSHSQYLHEAGLFNGDGDSAAGSLQIMTYLLSLQVAIVAYFTTN